jgi:hypothetical protein
METETKKAKDQTRFVQWYNPREKQAHLLVQDRPGRKTKEIGRKMVS